MTTRLETKLQADIIKALNIMKIRNWRVSSVTMSNFPDVLCIINGFMVVIEVKRDTKIKARDGQLFTISRIQASQGYGAVIGSMEEFYHFIDYVKHHTIKIWEGGVKL